MKKFFGCLFFALFGAAQAFAQNALESLASESGGRLAASMLVIETGQSLWILPDIAAPMQDVDKFPVTVAVLAAVDQNKLKLEQKVLVIQDDLAGDEQYSPLRDEHPSGNFKITLKELMRFAIAKNDSTASDALLRLLGGPDAVKQYLAQLGIHDIKLLDTEKNIGKSWAVQYRNTATPKSMITLLQAIQQGKGLSKNSRDLLMKWMSDTEAGSNRIKGILPAGTPVAHVTGGSSTRNGLTAAHNDVGIITLPNGHHMAVAVFLTDSTAPTASRDLTIAKITKLGWDAWSGK